MILQVLTDPNLTHTIHVWYIYLHLVDFYGKCRQIYHTWILWVNPKPSSLCFFLLVWFLVSPAMCLHEQPKTWPVSSFLILDDQQRVGFNKVGGWWRHQAVVKFSHFYYLGDWTMVPPSFCFYVPEMEYTDNIPSTMEDYCDVSM